MKYRHKDKAQFNVRLSHFLYNGLDVISAQLGMNRSEVIRLALYNLLKETYTKKEMDWFAGRDDIVEEWIELLKQPGRAGDFILQKLKEEKEKDNLERYQEILDGELEKRLKPIKKKYGFFKTQEFLREMKMTPIEAIDYFKNYKERERKEFTEYYNELKKYFKTKYPKEVEKVDAKLEKLTGMTRRDYQIQHLDNWEKNVKNLRKNPPDYINKNNIKEWKKNLDRELEIIQEWKESIGYNGEKKKNVEKKSK